MDKTIKFTIVSVQFSQTLYEFTTYEEAESFALSTYIGEPVFIRKIFVD